MTVGPGFDAPIICMKRIDSPGLVLPDLYTFFPISLFLKIPMRGNSDIWVGH